MGYSGRTSYSFEPFTIWSICCSLTTRSCCMSMSHGRDNAPTTAATTHFIHKHLKTPAECLQQLTENTDNSWTCLQHLKGSNHFIILSLLLLLLSPNNLLFVFDFIFSSPQRFHYHYLCFHCYFLSFIRSKLYSSDSNESNTNICFKTPWEHFRSVQFKPNDSENDQEDILKQPSPLITLWQNWQPQS